MNDPTPEKKSKIVEASEAFGEHVLQPIGEHMPRAAKGSTSRVPMNEELRLLQEQIYAIPPHETKESDLDDSAPWRFRSVVPRIRSSLSSPSNASKPSSLINLPPAILGQGGADDSAFRTRYSSDDRRGAGMIYQGLCIVMSLFAKPVRFPDAPMTNRYAVLISARNEEKVIGNLIGSIRDQTYRPTSSTSGWWPTTAPTTPPTWCGLWAAMWWNATILSWLARDMR